jgi:hypothetical protein
VPFTKTVGVPVTSEGVAFCSAAMSASCLPPFRQGWKVDMSSPAAFPMAESLVGVKAEAASVGASLLA